MTHRNNKGGTTTNETAPCEHLERLCKNITYIDRTILFASLTTLIRNRADRKRYILLLQAYGFLDDVIAKRLLAIHGLCGV